MVRRRALLARRSGDAVASRLSIRENALLAWEDRVRQKPKTMHREDKEGDEAYTVALGSEGYTPRLTSDRTPSTTRLP
jgi:hypothetical protein